MHEEDIKEFKKRILKKLLEARWLEKLTFSNIEALKFHQDYDSIQTKIEFTRFYSCIVGLALKYCAIQVYIKLFYRFMLLDFATKFNTGLKCRKNHRHLL